MKSKKDKLTLIIFSIILISTLIIAYILIPMNLITSCLFIVYILLEAFLFNLFILSTYGFVCINCGFVFNISLFSRILSLKKDKKCPKCKSLNIIKEQRGFFFLDNFIDLDED